MMDAPRQKRRAPGSGGVKVRRATINDIPAIYEVQAAAYGTATGLCDTRQLTLQLEAFPEGQNVALLDDRVVGYTTSLIVQIDDSSPWYSYSEITGGGTFSTHDPSGDTLYGADIAVHPDFRRRGIANKLYEARRKLVRRFNLRRMVAGGRIPGYRKHAGKLTPEEYVEKVIAGELTDPSLNAHLRAGYQVRGVHMGYLADAHSLDFATFLEYTNPRFNSERRRIAGSPINRPVRKIRVCSAQYEMRRVASWGELEQQVDFFISTAVQYHCHFLLFPELFTAQLFSMLDPRIPSKEAVSVLATMTDRYVQMFRSRATKTGLYIIGGSHPVKRGEYIYNVAHLFSPAGDVYTQDKLHVTPNERDEYGIRPGEEIRIFVTPYGRIGILVCYDVEFPELARLMTLYGIEVLFVPFSTDEKKAYLRVRYTAQARAVENIIYVALSGNVGNLPQVENFLINYGQAVICTPSDFHFPTDALAAAADLNTETVVIADLDLGALEQAREFGSVRPLRDRRTDLYWIESSVPIRVIRTS